MKMALQLLFAINLTLGSLTLSGCVAMDSQNQRPEDELPTNVPAALSVQLTQKLTIVAKAVGVQIYECGVDKNKLGVYTWNLKAPEAELFNSQGDPIGKHYAGPTWEARDGSKVVGQVKASDKGTDVNAIAWLLLNAKSNEGVGLFEHTTNVQRLNTVGGKAPADGCDQTRLGIVTRIPYTAKYYFYN
jgi:hypothetical protein